MYSLYNMYDEKLGSSYGCVMLKNTFLAVISINSTDI